MTCIMLRPLRCRPQFYHNLSRFGYHLRAQLVPEVEVEADDREELRPGSPCPITKVCWDSPNADCGLRIEGASSRYGLHGGARGDVFNRQGTGKPPNVM
jgi:hypothetical protein